MDYLLGVEILDIYQEYVRTATNQQQSQEKQYKNSQRIKSR